MSRSVRTLIVLYLLVSASTVVVAQSGSGCRVHAEPTRRVQLPDGRAISTDVKSIAASGSLVMAAGNLAYVFPRVTTPRTDPVMRDSLFGFQIDGRGNASIVPRPPGVMDAYYPRVAAAGNGSFHVLYTSAEDQPFGADTLPASATIWYARYDNGRWSTPELVAATRGARLSHAWTSALVERAGELSFVFPFGTPAEQGLVLLRRIGNRWRQDTLRTDMQPVSAAVAPASDGSLTVAFTMPGREAGRSFTDRFFTTRFDGTWSVPIRTAGDGTRQVTIPKLLRVGPSVVATWIEWTFGQATTTKVHVVSLGGASAAGVVSSGKGSYPFEAMVLENRIPVWLFRGEPYGTTLSVAVANGAAVDSLDTFAVPFENPAASAVGIGDGRVLVLTMQQGKLPDEAMVASFATILRFRCPDPARRE